MNYITTPYISFLPGIFMFHKGDKLCHRDNAFYRFSDVDYIAHIEKWNDYETGRYFRASVSALILTNEKLYADNQRLTAKLKHFEEDKEI